MRQATETSCSGEQGGPAQAWSTRGRWGSSGAGLGLPGSWHSAVLGQAGRAGSGSLTTRRESKDLGRGQGSKLFGKHQVWPQQVGGSRGQGQKTMFLWGEHNSRGAPGLDQLPDPGLVAGTAPSPYVVPWSDPTAQGCPNMPDDLHPPAFVPTAASAGNVHVSPALPPSRPCVTLPLFQDSAGAVCLPRSLSQYSTPLRPRLPGPFLICVCL